jgi:cytochrome c oxidase subunit II
MATKPHITTRRGFIAALGFGAVSLYGLWAAYGAAPLPFARRGSAGHDAHAGSHGSHGSHGGASHGPTPEEFNRMTADFIERYRLPDGTVHPRVLAASSPGGHGHDAMDHGAMDHGTMDHGAMDHGAMDHGAMDHGSMDHGAMDHGTMDHGAMDHGTMDHGADHPHDDAPLDVYLAAGMWYYLPARLRLDAGQAYRFRMMALDVSHGASIQFGKGGRMIRLRPGRVSEMDITFHKPGRYLVYCTIYCGAAHDYMQATVEVV